VQALNTGNTVQALNTGNTHQDFGWCLHQLHRRFLMDAFH
jgi:hypothetical protein